MRKGMRKVFCCVGNTFFGKRKKGSFSYVEIRSAAQEDDYI